MTENKKYKAVLFDYDGTLVDTNSLVIGSWQSMAVKHFGFKLPEKELADTFGKPLWDAVDQMAKKYGFGHLDTDMLVASYREYQKTHQEHTFWLFEGIEELLAELVARGVTLGIVTSRTRNTTLSGMEKLGIDPVIFGAIVTEDDTHIHKPLPDPALICCSKLGIDPGDAVMVGDSVFDLQCANNAGCASCFVTWSFCTSLEKAKAEGNPTYIVETAAEILELV